MKKTIALALITAFFTIPTAACAGEKGEFAGGYWKVSAIWIIKAPTGVEIRITQIKNYRNPREFEYIYTDPRDKACAKVNSLKPKDLVWIEMDVDGNFYIDFDRQPPASMELVPNLIK